MSLVTPTSGTPLPSACFYDANQQGQVTLADGYYKFDLNFADPACPSGGSVSAQRATPPSTRYLRGSLGDHSAADRRRRRPRSPCRRARRRSTTPCPRRRSTARSTASELQPPASVAPGTAGTNYHLHLTLDDSLVPGSSQIFNNHIPLDLDLDESVNVTKTTPLVHVSRGQLVPYIITVHERHRREPAQTSRSSTASRPASATSKARRASTACRASRRSRAASSSWTGLTVTPDSRHELKLLLAVGSGVGEGEFVNRAQAMSALTGGACRARRRRRVRIVPDPALDCTDVIGKVFDDENRNGLQDEGERGIPGVRLATARGLLATTDQFGRYHITCAITPHEGRGSNFVLKLDDRTLPSGYRGSTQSLQVQRATRGKMLEFNFGASIHRVIGLDLADAVFEPGSIEMRELWQPRLELLARGAARGAGRAAVVVSRRSRGSAARRRALEDIAPLHR